MPGPKRGALPFALAILIVFSLSVALAVVRGSKEEGPQALPTPTPTESPVQPSPTPTEVPSPEPSPTVEPSPTPEMPDGLAETGGNPTPWLFFGAALTLLSGLLWRVSRQPVR